MCILHCNKKGLNKDENKRMTRTGVCQKQENIFQIAEIMHIQINITKGMREMQAYQMKRKIRQTKPESESNNLETKFKKIT